MGSEDKYRNCSGCVHYYPLTKSEKEELKRLSASYAKELIDCVGLCIGTKIFPNQIIQAFIQNKDFVCSLYKPGHSSDNLHLICPSCGKGETTVSHVYKNGSLKILFGCTRCSFTTEKIKLNLNCRFCGLPLFLFGGDILRCLCLGCHKAVNLPVSIKTFPALAMPNGGCVHTGQFTSCDLCVASRQQRKNLLSLELPLMFRTIRTRDSRIVKTPKTIDNIPRSSKPYRPSYGRYNPNNSTYDDDGDSDSYVDNDRDDFNDDWWSLTDEDSGGNSFY